MTNADQTFTLKDCPPSLRGDFQAGYDTTEAGIESAGPDGIVEIEQWGQQARERLTSGTLAPASFWFLHGVRAAIAQHRNGGQGE
jgi:hypothetical protein